MDGATQHGSVTMFDVYSDDDDDPLWLLIELYLLFGVVPLNHLK